MSKWLLSIGHNFIRWPDGAELNKVQFANIPEALGATDVTHICIKRPCTNGQDYFNRKKYYSVSLQAVVSGDKKFIDIFAGEPGSLHDARILRRSGLYTRATANRGAWFPNGKFLIGDSAYPSLPWLVPVFKNYGNLTAQQKKFNYILSSSRIVVEHAFGLLKGRFRRLLHFTEHRHIPFVVNIIVCACILHNICIDQNDEFDEIVPEDDNDVSESEDSDSDVDEPEEHQDRRTNRDKGRINSI